MDRDYTWQVIFSISIWIRHNASWYSYVPDVFLSCALRIAMPGGAHLASSGGRAGGPGSGTSSRRLLRRSFSLLAGEFLLTAALAAALFRGEYQ